MKVFYYRTFGNKIWNAVKFALLNLKDFTPKNFEEISNPNFDQSLLTFSDKWILSRLDNCIKIANEAFDNFEFSVYTNACYQFWLFEFCDVYVEASKPVMQVHDKESEEQRERRRASQLVLYTCIEQGLRLLHPAMPYITEELWQRLPGRLQVTPESHTSIMINPYPRERGWRNEQIESDMELISKVVHGVRNTKALYNLTNKQRPTVFVRSTDEKMLKTIMDNALDVKTLSLCGELVSDGDIPLGCSAFVVNDQVVEYIDLTGLIDFKAELEKQKKKRDEKQKILTNLVTRMGSESYSKVPEHVKNDDKEKAETYKGEIEALEKNIQDLQKVIERQ